MGRKKVLVGGKEYVNYGIKRLGDYPDDDPTPERCVDWSTIHKTTGKVPHKVDLRRYMTDIEDQSRSGSCCANAVAGAYEYLCKRKALESGDAIGDVSRLFIYYVGRKYDQYLNKEANLKVKDEGMTLGGCISAVQQKGACLAKTYPFDLKKVNDRPPSKAFDEATSYKVSDAIKIPVDVTSMKECLANGYPIVFGLKLTKQFFSPLDGGIVLTPDPTDPLSAEHGMHAMLLVGYSDKQRVFIVRNSWGTDWGDGGYGYASYDYVANSDFNLGNQYAIKGLTDFDLTPETDSDDDGNDLPDPSAVIQYRYDGNSIPDLIEVEEDDFKDVQDVQKSDPRLMYSPPVDAKQRKTLDRLVSMCPFDAYHANPPYKWPTLYEELDEMIEANSLMFPMADLRAMVREGKLQDPKGSIMKMPLTATEVLSLIRSNEDKLKGSRVDGQRDEKSAFVLDCLNTIHERQKRSGAKKNQSYHKYLTSTLEAFDDEFALEELVYAVAVNHQRKRVTVCFRGSTTDKDWATDFQIWMKEVPNPIGSHTDQPPTIKLHHGFQNYLFAPSHRGAKGPNGEHLSEYQEILQEHLLPILKQYPGYKLYVTGHSLGGALCTLFAFQVATEPDSVIPKPVTCISIASPYVGDSTFREAHQLLESLGKLRHLRVSNHRDLVTIMPKMSFKLNLFDSTSHVGSLFKHVGMNLKLYGGKYPFEISYPKVRSGYVSASFDELSRGLENSFLTNISWNPTDYWKWPWHSLYKYNQRTERSRVVLDTMYLNELYSDKDIVGHLIAEF